MHAGSGVDTLLLSTELPIYTALLSYKKSGQVVVRKYFVQVDIISFRRQMSFQAIEVNCNLQNFGMISQISAAAFHRCINGEEC